MILDWGLDVILKTVITCAGIFSIIIYFIVKYGAAREKRDNTYELGETAK